MAIPDSQFETWSHQGATVSSTATYRSIQAALSASSSLIRDKDFEVYLQGSYKNDTNIRGDSDVDVVIQLNSQFFRDISSLPVGQQQLYLASFEGATYSWTDFRRDVLATLRAYYGSAAVSEGLRSLKVASGGGRLQADIIPAWHFRHYNYFFSFDNQGYLDGIRFFSWPDSRPIVNYPKLHYANGVKKNSALHTNGWFKPTVRIFKNARTRLIDAGALAHDIAPSYFVECLIYNVPDNCFARSYRECFVNSFNWLWEASPNVFSCENGLMPLFGVAPEQWNDRKAGQLLHALRGLWDNW
jgi:hypothetical protein